MQIFVAVLYVVFLLIIERSCSVIELQVEDDAAKDSVMLKTNMTRCPMFSKFCKIPFCLKNNVNYTLNVSEEYFKFLKIEPCITEEECLQNQGLNCTLQNILIDPIIVGKGTIVIKNQENIIQNYSVIVTSPQRKIDIFFQYYVIFFQAIISIFMGLLLDVKTLLKIIKMPIPVLIGILTQYVGMPLVIVNAFQSDKLVKIRLYNFFSASFILH